MLLSVGRMKYTRDTDRREEQRRRKLPRDRRCCVRLLTGVAVLLAAVDGDAAESTCEKGNEDGNDAHV